jgi:hypothetical protein
MCYQVTMRQVDIRLGVLHHAVKSPAPTSPSHFIQGISKKNLNNTVIVATGERFEPSLLLLNISTK